MARSMSLCLGLDVSPRRMGWALAHLEDGAPVACGVVAIDLPDHGWSPHLLRSGIEDIECGAPGEIHYCAVERPALPPKSGTNAAFNAGRAYQEAISAVRRRWPWAVVDEMQPSEWRKLAGLAGNASKVDVRRHADSFGFHVLGTLESIPPQDAADAACIALAGVERNRQTLATHAEQVAR